MVKNLEHGLSETLKKYIPDRINYSLEVMSTERNKNPLSTNNRLIPTFWDTLNGEINKYSANDTSISAFFAKRGIWEFILILDNNAGILYSLMKEPNFKLLKKNISQRKIPHYGDLLTRTFNRNLKDSEQVTLDGYMQLEPISFSDENRINVAIDKILINFNKSKSIIKSYAFILFDISKFEVTNIRSVITNSSFDICFEENWNKYIKVNYNMIPETIDLSDIIDNDPTRGLTLTKKSKDKIDQNNNIELKKTLIEKKS